MSSFLQWVSVALPFVFAIAGVFISLEKPRLESQRAKWFVRGGLLALGVAGSLVIAIEQNYSREYLSNLVTSRNNYFYFKAEFKNVHPGQKVPLRAITSGKVGIQAIVMISPLANHGDENNPLYRSLWPNPRVITAPAGGYLTEITIPEGKWLIQFVGLNAGWTEVLEIYDHNGLMYQSIKVTTDSETYQEAT